MGDSPSLNSQSSGTGTGVTSLSTDGHAHAIRRMRKRKKEKKKVITRNATILFLDHIPSVVAIVYIRIGRRVECIYDMGPLVDAFVWIAAAVLWLIAAQAIKRLVNRQCNAGNYII